MKKQEIVLKELLETGKKLTPKQISIETGIDIIGVYEALRGLSNRRLINKEKTIGKGGYMHPPKGTIKAYLRDDAFRRANRILKRAKNENRRINEDGF